MSEEEARITWEPNLKLALHLQDGKPLSLRSARKRVPYAIYILRCSDGTYYTGLTKDLEGRVLEHQTGKNPASYTFGRRPIKLMWSIVTESYQDAFRWEHQIKGWSRVKKEALIRSDIEGIHEVVKNERKRREKKGTLALSGVPSKARNEDEVRITKVVKLFMKLALRLHSLALAPLSAREKL